MLHLNAPVYSNIKRPSNPRNQNSKTRPAAYGRRDRSKGLAARSCTSADNRQEGLRRDGIVRTQLNVAGINYLLRCASPRLIDIG